MPLGAACRQLWAHEDLLRLRAAHKLHTTWRVLAWWRERAQLPQQALGKTLTLETVVAQVERLQRDAPAQQEAQSGGAAFHIGAETVVAQVEHA
eukprot:CAMPEP_0175757746 /NCGR_PEP_ID=MMETSP0097-20121207/64637_1 /TAXON_ID=311494 /ORGANISM="Alexandrium monilatum, Strain CCMP3105" /LENGTH=93 /DNA_ID=CAMNT_0017066967 /DNA_START=3 /DNA_END=280 /DNA_ORIENTATION=+